MAVAKNIRTKIGSIKSIRKITSAMELVAASKMRHAQSKMFSSRFYAYRIREVIGHLAKSHSECHMRYLESATNLSRIGLIVISSDRGLCGSLNTNLFRKTIAEVKAWQDQNIMVKYCLFGRKAEAFFKRGYAEDILGHTSHSSHLGDKPKIADVIGVVKVMIDAFVNGELDTIYIAYNDFINTMSQKPMIEQLLPLVPDQSDQYDYYWDYIYEPDSKEILELLIKRYIESQVYQKVLENNASEHAARMVAMKNASENAEDIIEHLQLIYNKARQAAITQEIAEIVGGASAV